MRVDYASPGSCKSFSVFLALKTNFAEDEIIHKMPDNLE